jgi:hypothetical protein
VVVSCASTKLRTSPARAAADVQAAVAAAASVVVTAAVVVVVADATAGKFAFIDL